MSFVKSPEIIYTRMREKRIRLYQVFDSDGKTLIDESDEDSETVDSAIDSLKQTLENLDGTIHVCIRVDGAARKRKADTSSAGSAQVDNYKGIFKFSMKLGGVETDKHSGSFSNNRLFDFAMNAMKEKHEAELSAIRTLNEMEKRMNEKIEKLEKKNGGELPGNFDKLIEAILTRLK